MENRIPSYAIYCKSRDCNATPKALVYFWAVVNPSSLVYGGVAFGGASYGGAILLNNL